MYRLYDLNDRADQLAGVLHEIRAVIALVERAVVSDQGIDDELVKDGAFSVLMATGTAIEGVTDMVERLVSDPYAAGYRKGMDFADAEYRRGFTEGRKAAGGAA